MKAIGKTGNVTIFAMLAIVALAIAFWMLLLSPKRDEAAALAKEIDQVEVSLAQHRAEVEEAEAAREDFPTDYQKLVVLGKAVPGDDDTASLLVQMTATAKGAEVAFQDIELISAGGEAPAPAQASPDGTQVSATEAAASLMPLGATVGPAGLAAMPYSLTFRGSFFQIADFIDGMDSLVNTNQEGVVVEGRLITIDGFTLKANEKLGFPNLEAEFSVTTYVTPPGESGLGTAPESLGAETATPAATTTGGAP